MEISKLPIPILVKSARTAETLLVFAGLQGSDGHTLDTLGWIESDPVRHVGWISATGCDRKDKRHTSGGVMPSRRIHHLERVCCVPVPSALKRKQRHPALMALGGRPRLPKNVVVR
jgi:hypothetical protein